MRLITQQVQLVPDAIKATDVPPVPASTLAANPDTRREINLTYRFYANNLNVKYEHGIIFRRQGPSVSE